MRNNFFLFTIFCLLVNVNLYAEDIEIYSDNIKILDNNNIIKSVNSKAIIKEKKLLLVTIELTFLDLKNIMKSYQFLKKQV